MHPIWRCTLTRQYEASIKCKIMTGKYHLDQAHYKKYRMISSALCLLCECDDEYL